MSAPPASTLALATGGLAAVMQLAGALKTAAPLPALPADLTLLSLALLLPLLGLLAVTRRWRLAPALALPLAAAALLWAWLVVAGAWTPSRQVLAAKLPEVALGAPAMLLAGLLVGAEPSARRGFCGGTLLLGLALAVAVGAGAAAGWAPFLLAEAEAALVPVNYQILGLALASTAALAAIRLVEARGILAGLGWGAAVVGLAAAALLPGGRTALLALLLGVAVAPALRLGARGGLAWGALMGLLALAALAWLLARPDLAEGLRTLERLTGEPAGLDARRDLWAAALAWAGEAAPFGLGTGGFAIAAGHGERRGFYPHNHALEILAEAGLPGLVLWLVAFGGGALAALRLARRCGRGRVARIAAVVLPVALASLVSSDLGNRMTWFALGLALSLGVTALVPVPVPVPAPSLGEPRHV